MRTSTKSAKLSALAGGALISGLLAMSAAYADSPVAAEPGVWEKHEYSFAFLGFTSTYSCDGLADQLKRLLIASGARADAKARAGACAAPYGRPDKFARADLTFYTLSPAASAKNPDGAPVDGIWIPVAIAFQQPRNIGRGDCELIEQFRTNVLPMFTTRNVENHTTCIPHQESGSDIDLKFESFSVPPKAKPVKQAPRS